MTKVFTPQQIKATRQKIQNAGVVLLATAPHFGLAWAKMRPIAVVPSETQGGTWEVDLHGKLYADPDFTATLTDGHAQFILAHEIMHVLSDHQHRSVVLGLRDDLGYTRPGKDGELQVWQFACDMAINHALKKDGVGDCPSHALLPPDEYIASGFRLDAESIYFWLLKHVKFVPMPKPGQGQTADGKPMPGAGCDALPGPAQGQGQGQGDQPGQGQGQGAGAGGIDWREVAREVEATARTIGGKFAGRGSAVADLLAPPPSRIDWRKLCKQGFDHVSAEAEERSRRSYSRLARRPELVPGILRPGHIGTDGSLAGVCDVSGSITREQVAQIAGHMMKLCKQYPNVRVIFVAHTDRVEYAAVLKPGGDMAKLVEGLSKTGGTRVRPAYDKVLELNGGRPVDNCIHFTDGYIENPWPDAPGKRFIVGQIGTGDGGTKKPAKARVVPVAMD